MNLRSGYDTFFFTFFVLDAKRGIFLILSLLSFAYGVLGKFMHTQETSIPFFIGLAFLALSGYRIILESFKTDGLHIVPDTDLLMQLESLTPSVEEKKLGFVLVKNPLRAEEPFIYSRDVNRWLQKLAAKVPFQIESAKTRSLRELLQSKKNIFSQIIRQKWSDSMHQGKVFINESKVGLSGFLPPGGKVSIFKTDYFSTFLTYGLATSKVYSIRNGRKTLYYSGSDHYPLVKNKAGLSLKNLEELEGSNHVGISVIALTKDKYLCFWEQTSKSQFSEGLLTPTASGSLDWDDIKSDDLVGLILNGARRELVEECNRRNDKLTFTQKDINRMQLLGYFRDVVRAGKPEFLVIGLLDINNTALQPSWEGIEADTGENRKPAKSFADFRSIVKDMITTPNYLRRLSRPLHAGLISLNDFIKTDPDTVQIFFGYK